MKHFFFSNLNFLGIYIFFKKFFNNPFTFAFFYLQKQNKERKIKFQIN